jgi:hypothetical protein
MSINQKLLEAVEKLRSRANELVENSAKEKRKALIFSEANSTGLAERYKQLSKYFDGKAAGYSSAAAFLQAIIEVESYEKIDDNRSTSVSSTDSMFVTGKETRTDNTYKSATVFDWKAS